MTGTLDEKGNIPLCGPALVLLSGGMDSVACLHWALGKHREVRAVGFDYGQPHRDAELTAAGTIAKRRMVPFEIELLHLRGGLRDGVADHSDAPGLSKAFVPARNGAFLQTALNIFACWRPLSPVTLVIGACREDADAFPDCREKYFKDLERAMTSGLDRPVQIAAPYVRMPKAGIIRDLELRFPSGLEDIQESWSCYRGTKCGTCTACVLRGRAFAAHALEDLAAPPMMHGGDAERGRRLGA